MERNPALEIASLKSRLEYLEGIVLRGEAHIPGQAEYYRAIEALKQGATDYVLKDRLSRLVPVVRRALKEAELRAIQKQADQALRDSLKQKEAFIEEIRRLNRLYDVLSQVNQAVVRIQSRDELLSTVCRLVVERGEIDLAWIGRIDKFNNYENTQESSRYYYKRQKDFSISSI